MRLILNEFCKQWVKELLVEIRNEDSIELEGGKNYGRTKTSKLVR